MTGIDKKINELRKYTENFLFIEYYSHTQCEMYKILNPYTHYKQDKVVLCPVEDGIAKALDKAIKHIAEQKIMFELGRTG